MTIEIKDYPDSRFSGIRIAGENGVAEFTGVVDWTPGRKFGLAVGRELHQLERRAIFLAGGVPAWSEPVGNPTSVRLIENGMGAFVDGERLIVFYVPGVLFASVLIRPPFVIDRFEVNDEGFCVDRGWRREIYSASGRLRREESI